MNPWWLVALLLAALALAVRVALYYRDRALYFHACKNAQVAESARLAQMLRDGEAAYAALQENLAVGGWVRLPTDQELEMGQWS